MFNSIEQVTSFMTGLLAFVVILIGAYFAARFIGKKGGFCSSNGKNIKVIEKTNITQDKSLVIVKTAGKTMLLGVSNAGVNLICELDEENIVTQTPNTALNSPDFSAVFKNVLDKCKGGEKK